jgi:CHAT domain-containing protein
MAAESNALRTLFGTPGAVDLFHFSGHGVAEAQTSANQSTRAQLLLQGRVENNAFIPLYLDDRTVQQYGRIVGPDGNRPLVVLNACQVGRANWQLTSIGGFAEAFLRMGAGAFVGTLWSVGDEPAHNFTEAFYSSLLGGHTVVEATSAGREAARKAGEATWLAYVVYAHPQAVLQLEDAGAAASLPPARASQPAGVP